VHSNFQQPILPLSPPLYPHPTSLQPPLFQPSFTIPYYPPPPNHQLIAPSQPSQQAPLYTANESSLNRFTAGIHLSQDVFFPNGIRAYDSLHRIFYHENGQIAYEFRSNQGFYNTGSLAHVYLLNILLFL
jgi:hypothetical protein